MLPKTCCNGGEKTGLALEQNDTAREVRAHQLMGQSSHWLGAFSRAVGHFERTLSVRTSEENPATDLFGRTLVADSGA